MHLYLDYQDGEWPEIHTVSFSPGTHDWEKKTIMVEPQKPVKTAMILLEFQQRYDTTSAWFDDLFLAQTTVPDKNLLAYPGFEAAPFMLATLSAEYEKKIMDILGLLTVTRDEGGLKKQISALKKETESLEDWITKIEVARFWGREVRDLCDVKEKLALCSRILYGR